MALSRSCCSLLEEKMVPPVIIATTTATAAAATAMSPPPLETATEGNNEELVKIRAAMVCAGCRCGWLCCDCFKGCLACKQRRRFCYCRLVTASLTGEVFRVYCEICVDLLKSCQCQLAFRCKWCTVSLEKCKKGGCVSLLPSRVSPEAAPFVDIFNREDKTDEEDEVVREGQNGEEADKRSMSSWSSSTSTTTLSRTTSTSSVESAAQEEWWRSQRSRHSSGVSSAFGSNTTLDSVSSGGSYNSVGGRSDV